MDVPDEYPPLPDGLLVPFTPATRPRPTDNDRERVLRKHRHGANDGNRTMFPDRWSDDDIMAAVDLTTALPDAGSLERFGDQIRFERVVDGELVRVHVRTDGIVRFWSAYPPNGTMGP